MENEILVKSYINKSLWFELHDSLCFAINRLRSDIDLHSDNIDVDYYSSAISHLQILSFFMRCSVSSENYVSKSH